MQSFFRLALVLMNRLSYPRKFALLGSMSLIAIAVVMFGLYAGLKNAIHTSEQELEGVSLITPISRAIQFVQQHRGLSVGAISGIESMRVQRAAKEIEVTESLQRVAERLSPALKADIDWKSIQGTWEHLQKAGPSLTAAESFAVHTRLIEQMLNIEVIVADNYDLTVDPEVGSYNLVDTVINKLPIAQEQIGRIRAYGTGIIATKQVTEEQRLALHAISIELGSALKSLRINLDKTGRYNPEIQATLSTVSNDLTDSSNKIIELTSDILTGHSLTRPEDYFAATTTALDRSYFRLHEAILPALEILLRARITQKEQMLYASIGIAILLFVIVTYFSIGMYLATIGSIRSLARSANKFANGDMWERIDLGTHDELQQIGESFNQMADASCRITAHLLETQKTLEQDIADRKAAEKKLGFAYEQLELMAKYLETIREEEQKRIARELHDEMGGVLAALNMKVARLGAKLSPELTQLSNELNSMTKLVAAAIQTMRHTVARLRPSVLDDAGLAAAIECYATEFQESTGIECRMINRLPEEEPTLNHNRSSTIFRILQESLTNVAKHAQAAKVTIILKEQGESLVLMVHDNGIGIAQSAGKEKSFGLRGIRERVFMVGGRVKIRSAPGKGTTLWVSVPLHALAQKTRATG